MKHTVLFLFRFFLIVGALTTGAKAQNANIATVLQMSPNPSPYLSDWQSRRETVTLTATLDRPYGGLVKLTVQVKLNGNIVAETDINKMPALTLHQGVNTFNAADLIPFNAVIFKGGIDKSAQRLGRLPEGQYEICVFLKGVDIIQPDPLVADCHSFMIIDREPARLVSPADGSHFYYSGSNRVIRTNRIHDAITITQLVDKSSVSLFKESLTLTDASDNYFHYSLDRGSKQYLSGSIGGHNPSFHFALTDMHVKSLQEPQGLPFETMKFEWLPMQGYEQIEYKIRIVEVLPGQAPEQAIMTGTPIIEKDKIYIPRIDFSSLPAEPIIENITMGYGDVKYAWAVQTKLAKDKWGAGMKNNGWSEVRTFRVKRTTSKPIVRGPQTGLIQNPDTTKPVFINSFFDVFADPIDWVDANADSLKKLADSLRSKAIRLLDKVIDVEKIKEIIKIIDDSIKVAKPKPDPEPCPHVDKKLLRTVTGAWKKISTTVRHITVGKRTVAWVDVVWERDVFNVFAVSKCTLLKGHGGAHKMSPAVEVKEKYGTFTETISYGPGVPHSPPKPHPTDALPEE